jgi:phage I-like protein
MDIGFYLSVAGGILALCAIITAAIVVIRSTTSKETVQNQKALIETLKAAKDEQKDQIADLQQKHVDSSKAIAGLQGQVDVLKNIPLKEISSDLKSIAGGMNSLSQNQERIVSLIQNGGSDTTSPA